MYRNGEQRLKDCVAIALVAALVCAAPLSAQDSDGADSLGPEDRLEAYLLDRGMLELLVRQLEERIATERRSRDRAAVAEKLASVYASLLSSASSVEEQRRWEVASEKLLLQVPEANTIELRLGLARAAYTRTESVAEKYALRMITESERIDALQRLGELRSRFASIGQEADRRVRDLEREEDRGPRVESEWLREALALARRQRSMAFYLAGWSSYYVAELSSDVGAATDAVRHFGWLLGAERNSEPRLDNLQMQSLQYEHIARSALATAAAYSLMARHAIARQWLDALDEYPDLPNGVRSQLQARRITIHASENNWDAVAATVSRLRSTGPLRQLDSDDESGTPLSVGHARQLAVLCFEEIARSGESAYMDWRVQRLRDLALGDLVIQDQLGHVLDLATRYQTERFGDRSFISLHIRGLRLYQDAREAHSRSGEDANSPSNKPDIVATYQKAAELLQHSLSADDAARFTAARANTRMLVGLAGYYSGGSAEQDGLNLIDAANELALASEEFSDRVRSADALWMAIRSLDVHLSQEEGVEDVSARRDALVARFLREHPDDEKSAALILRLAESEHIPESQRIQLLMAVPEGNPLRLAAVRKAASIAYDMYRSATEENRDLHAMRFAEIAEPLVAIEFRRAVSGDMPSQRLAVARARQIADAMLRARVPDLARAERAVALLERMLIDGFEGAAEAESEIRFRRAQLALASGRSDEAERIIADLRESGTDFGQSSIRLFYRDAAIEFDRLTRGNADPVKLAQSAHRLMRVGRDLLEELVSDGTTHTEEHRALIISVRKRVATAAQRVWELESDRDALSIAVSQYRAILELDGRNSDALRGIAVLGSAYGDDRAALDAWRSLVAGSKPGSEAWFEARTGHLLALERVDAARAAEVLRQHVTLYPNLAPQPYAEVLRELADRLGVPVPREGAAR